VYAVNDKGGLTTGELVLGNPAMPAVEVPGAGTKDE